MKDEEYTTKIGEKKKTSDDPFILHNLPLADIDKAYAIKCYVEYKMSPMAIYHLTKISPCKLNDILGDLKIKQRRKVVKCRHNEGFCSFDSTFKPVQPLDMDEQEDGFDVDTSEGS